MADPTGSTDSVPPPECADCGAPVTHRPGTTTLQCSRWQSHQCEIVAVAGEIREHPFDEWADGQQVAPAAVVPFSLDRSEAVAVLRGWLGSRRFAPRALREIAGAESLQSTYLPHWAFSAHTSSDYRGGCGTHFWTTETYTTTDSQGNSQTHTRSVQNTSWAKRRGTVTRYFRDILVVATSHLDSRQLKKVSPWPLEQAVPYQPEYGYGHHSLPYDVPLDAGLTQAKQVMATGIEALCRTDIGGDEQRVDTVETSYANVTYKLVLFPAWISSYRYADKTWQVVVNGYTGTVHGGRPYSASKILLAVVAGLAALAAVIALLVSSGTGR